jgi:hypothetical protein
MRRSDSKDLTRKAVLCFAPPHDVFLGLPQLGVACCNDVSVTPSSLDTLVETLNISSSER